MIGIYLLKKEGQVVYVGQSIDCEKRIAGHKLDFDESEIIKVLDECLLDSEEKKYIRKYQPPLNKKLFDQPDKPYSRPTVKIDFTKDPTLLEDLYRYSRDEGYTNVTHYILKALERHCRNQFY